MTCAPLNPYPEATAFRRAPDQVMRLARMGSAHPTRLSFLRVVLRQMRDQGWRFDRPVWQVDTAGVGHAVYRAIGPERTYSLVAFAHDLPDDMRSDRVIATAWDATFCLFDGTPGPDDITRLAANVPLQEAGRITGSELCLARANRSVRLFAYVVDCLARGVQPDAAELDAVGYLMRTTAVYGAGKFGAADRDSIAARPELSGPFRAEMITVWLIRAFTADLVDHLAQSRGGATATKLAAPLRRRLGVGNSTGLGMAPFLVRHPTLLNNWMLAREEALARVRAQTGTTPATLAALHNALDAATKNAASWHSTHPIQIAKLADLRGDLALIAQHLQTWPRPSPHPWDALWQWGQAALTLEGQEAILALILEPHGTLIDGLADCMDADEPAAFRIDGAESLAHFSQTLRANYAWALGIDYTTSENAARFWYVSEEKLEPRLGDRFAEDGASLELPLATGRMAAHLARDLATFTDGNTLAAFLLAHPEHRLMARRVQTSARYPFAEIRDNLIAESMLPIDLLRCKLAFFGASHFDPRSDRWVRIALFQNMPYPADLAADASNL